MHPSMVSKELAKREQRVRLSLQTLAGSGSVAADSDHAQAHIELYLFRREHGLAGKRHTNGSYLCYQRSA